MSRQQDLRPGPRRSQNDNNDRARSKTEAEQSMWSSMLNSVSSGKKLPEKNLLILGGTTKTQREFLEILESDNGTKRSQDRYRKRPPTANEFALGYTYQDILDADHEDLLARLSVYFVSEPSPAFAPLVKPVLSSRAIPETLIVIILDWTEPWRWIRELRDWIRFLRSLTSDLSGDAKEAAEETMKEWQQRRIGRTFNDAGGTNNADTNVALPLSQGEWDEPLGLPLCVACHRADKIDDLETRLGWREEDFDYILQYLRVVLMKHGSSLIYTALSSPNFLPALIHSSLGIQSLLKKQNLKHNVIDRDKILVPPNWDSWGKIRVLREGFDVEGVSSGWSTEIQPLLAPELANANDTADPRPNSPNSPPNARTALQVYEETVRDPHAGSSKPVKASIEVQAPSMQNFLSSQLEAMERLKREEDQAAAAEAREREKAGKSHDAAASRYHDSGAISDQIGPVQFNMGGIQVDAEEMLQRLKNGAGKPNKHPEESQLPDAYSPYTPAKAGTEKANNEQLASFFAGLMKKDRTGSPRGERGS